MKAAEGPFWNERGTPVFMEFTHKLVYRVVGPTMRRVGRVDHQGLAQFACSTIKTPVGRLGPRRSSKRNSGSMGTQCSV